MEILKFILFLIFLFFISTSVHSKSNCPTLHCGNNKTFPIQPPFKLQNQQTQINCTYITNLTCTNQGLTILSLPNSGDFYVRHIDYKASVVQLYDPENCLPKRLMNLNLSFSYPLKAVNQLGYTFYKCPPDVISVSNFTAIGCMSNSSVSIVATHTVPSLVMKVLYRCDEIVTSNVPALAFDDQHDFNRTDFFLKWCDICSSEAESWVARYIFQFSIILMLVGVVMPPVICIACCAHFGRMLRKNDATINISNVR